ncbi:FTR1 family iron permease [Bacillus sp. 1P06AnD]|uniref:FTR1 family iron permease n=1 Tax=Bacillus sp. 1P06AnD TaxID=3132208 RepID=UPI0039A37E17
MATERVMAVVKKWPLVWICCLLLLTIGTAAPAYAKTGQAETSAKALISPLEEVKSNLEAGKAEEAATAFAEYKKDLLHIKNDIRNDSQEALGSIQSATASLSLSLLNEDQKNALHDTESLIHTIEQYSGGTLQTDPNKIEEKSLASYIALLKQTKQSLENKDYAKAEIQVNDLTQQWLSVEGDVVSQSQSVYNGSEKNLVLLSGYVKEPAKANKAISIVDKMVEQLTPLQKDAYGMWDAAFIPIREGVEALLVIGALLTVTKKSNVARGQRWVWGGTLLGVLASLAIGFGVTYLLSATAFGQNNFLLNGWSGIIAALMLLYVSYWLHRNTQVKQWNQFIKGKTASALSSGKMLSFAFLAFLAILREGLETVIFLIGMVNRMPMGTFITGIIVGFGILVIIGFVMLKLGASLPLKPFFFVSSIFVFYLCVKFLGSGIHSLQLAGILDSAVNESIPTISFLGVYPSWYSTLPQLIIVAAAIIIVGKKYINKQIIARRTGGSYS